MSMFISVVLERGEIPEDVSGGPGVGKSFADRFDDLDATARGLELRPLRDFYVDYMEQLEALWTSEVPVEDMDEAASRVGADGPWFDPEEGLRTVHGLIEHLEASPASDEGTLTVLRCIASELAYAQHEDVGFHLAFHE